MQNVDVKVRDRVATILIDRPRVAGAISPGLIDDLRQAIDDVHTDGRLDAAVLTATGANFCSGVDLNHFADILDRPQPDRLPAWFEYWQSLGELLEAMLRFPKPIVAAVDGAAVGAGVALALAADAVLMTRDATLHPVAVHRGLVGGPTAALMHFRVGGAVASRWLLAAAPIDSAECHRVGLTAAEPVDPTQIWVAAQDLAGRLGAGPGGPIAATKRLVNETMGEPLFTQLAAASAASATACSTEIAEQRIRQFINKTDG